MVPGNIDVDSCKGSNALLRDGAIAVSSGWDVVGEYAAQFPERVRKNDASSRQTAYPDEISLSAKQEEMPLLQVAQKLKFPTKAKKEKTSKKKKEIDNGASPLYSDAETQKAPLSETEQTIVDHLRRGDTLVDDVFWLDYYYGNGTTTERFIWTFMLQIKGVVKLLPGKQVHLNEK